MLRLIDPARRRALACLGVGAFIFLLLPGVAEPKNCEVGSPAFGVEQGLWGTLKPVDAGQLPDARDSSNYNGTQRPDDVVYRVPLFTSVEIENGWIFQTYTQGLKIWDANGGNATNPSLVTTRDCQGSGFLRCLPGQHELRELFWDVDAPDGNDSVIAVASAPLGMMIFDTTSKGNPTQVYQDYNVGMYQVWTATIGNKHWAFAATEGATANDALGVRVYDMSAALGLNGCIDEPESRNCGVHRGRVGAARAVSYIDGLRRSDGRFFIASSPGGRGGVEIYDVTNPLAAQSVSGPLFSSEFTYGLAMWEQGGKQFLGMQYILAGGAGQGGRIYDITNCLNGNCSGLSPIWNKSWSVGAARHFLTYSKSGSKHFLYFGNEDKCSGGLQREWLFDVSNLASGVPPTDLTPPQKISVTANNETATVDYWSWYYASNPKGFSEVMPRMGKVNGSYFYRAAWTIFDIHEITGGVPPTAEFSWNPTEIYPGTQVTFTSNSPGATSWSWTFPDGSNAASATAAYTFGASTAPGSYPVKLDVSNAAGPAAITKNVTVINPVPTAGAVGTPVPSPALICQDVTFTASGFKGKPPLTYSWEVLKGSTVVDSQSGVDLTTFKWDNTSSQTADSYTGRVTVSNGSGSVQVSSPVLQLTNLPALQFVANPPTCTNCTAGSPPAGTAFFSVQAAGATQWIWDFNGNNVFGDAGDLDTTDPVVGPAPSFSYTSTGPKTVRVKIVNCQNPGGIVSEPLTVTIQQINPLVINGFAAACNFNPCEFTVNQQVSFAVDVTGDPLTYKFDWDGNGTYDETSPTPIITHTYTVPTATTICPKLRVERGAEFKELQASTCFRIVAGGPPPPPPPSASISVAGPASGQINQALSFTASASNCTPAATWGWNASGGGTVSGSGNSVTITWTTTGQKTVTATNSGCSGASGSRPVNIGDTGNPGPNGLSANFTFSPSSPQPGQQVSFDAGSSGGAPATYLWTFGDGTAPQSSNTATTTHTFAAAGTYPVKLEVGKQGDCPFGLCTANTTKVVVVGGGGPPAFQASFTSNAECVDDFGVSNCTVPRGQQVTFTSTTSGATSNQWSFGDGGTATGTQVTHTWNAPGNYPVQLTAGNGTATATVSRTFMVTGEPVAQTKAVVLPWIAQTRGALVQSSDLYIHNPTSTAMDVKIQFRRRGVPESTPPEALRKIEPGATLFVADVLNELFDRENIAGFVSVVVENGSAEPVINSFNTTFQNDGSQFGQTIPGISLSRTTSAAGSGPSSRMQHLVGLNDNGDRLAYFGLSNPSGLTVSYRLRFFDQVGRQIGQPVSLSLGGFSQKQFQVKEIREQFGITDIDDYRIEIETTSAGSIFPYGANLRRASEDPSFVGAGSSDSSKVYLVGALSSPGPNNSIWQSDVVLSNTGSEVALTDMWFTPVGVNSNPTQKVTLTLQPGETERLTNVIADKWGITDSAGVLILDSDAPQNIFPVIQGESYDNAKPAKKFGQTIPAFTDADAAGAGRSHYLVGLRQDAKHRTTYWLYNPGTTTAEYEIVYLGLDGKPLGEGATIDIALGAGKARQMSPGQHPLPKQGVKDGFTVRINVKSGQVLSAGQVVNNATNDPAYVKGELR